MAHISESINSHTMFILLCNRTQQDVVQYGFLAHHMLYYAIDLQGIICAAQQLAICHQ